ncbi:MAG: glycosyltransferase [Chloroflexi bacterium]|nr:glycosyltransferase [Chloroflexota bacterium]
MPAEARARLREIGVADVVVGVPSYQNEATIGHVVRTAAEGLIVHFPHLKSVIVNSDGGSSDNTRRVVANVDVPGPVEKLTMVYRGLPGKGSACRAIFDAAVQLGARACIVVDSDLRSITPQWIERLAGPLVAGDFDFVAPSYIRHKYDGTITNNIAYPLTRALYGLRVRQPIGGDFGVSGALASRFARGQVWQTDVARFGIDIWMTTTAVNEGFRICQASLGAKVHDAKDPAASLGPMFAQVVGTLFSLMETYEEKWLEVESSELVPVYGAAKHLEPEPIVVTLPSMIDNFRAGATRLGRVWRKILTDQTFKRVMDCATLGYEDYVFPSDIWAKVVYDFAVGHRAWARRNKRPTEILEALTALYFGRTAGLIIDSAQADGEQFEDLVEQQALMFERLKPHLVRRWKRIP